MQDFFSIGFYDTLIRFAVCIFVNWSIVHFLYFRKSHRRDFYFTFVIISIAIFFLVYLMMGMDRGKATMGVGLGSSASSPSCDTAPTQCRYAR